MIDRLTGLAAAAAAMMAATAAVAFPERPITLIVPFSAGGNSDVIARLVADHVSADLGQPVVVDNRGGGGGTIGSTAVAKAAPDGYTLLLATAGTHSINPSLRKVGYDPVGDFAPVSMVVDSSVLIAVNSGVKATTLKELIALATAPGAALTYASGGTGTIAHVAGVLFNERTGADLTHVPYQGAGAAMLDVAAGRVDIYMNNIPAFLPHIASGAVRPLAVAAAEPSALLPGVPTTGEAGLADFEMGSWFGLLAPAGTPAPVVDKLHASLVRMAGKPEIVAKFRDIGTEVKVSATPAAFGEEMRRQLGWWGKVLENPELRAE
jgi:tripartite-type tricarboxylate transporter receptor subunit TctC